MLPVALMASFGFWAILRQRNAVQMDAQQRAGEIVQTWPIDFGRTAAMQLVALDGSKQGWLNYLRWGVSPWPNDSQRQQRLADGYQMTTITNDLADLKAAFPDWKQGEALPMVNFVLQTNGDVYDARLMPPNPPSWLSTMSTPQYEAWAALEAADFANRPAPEIGKLAGVFEQMEPPRDARVDAEFISLRADSRTDPATNAIIELSGFAGRHLTVLSDSGLPVSTLALAEALKRSHECGPTRALWMALNSEINAPDILAPALLDEAAELITNNIPLSQSVDAMKILLADKEMQNELSEAVRASGIPNGVITTNLWVGAMGQRWFCILQPVDVSFQTRVSNYPITITDVYTRVRCYPESLVTRAFAQALGTTRVTIPDYFSIGADLEGMPLVLPPPWNHCGTNLPVGNRLMWRNFQMTFTAGTFPEDMPSHPQFTLQVQLTNPGMLYARQRQIQLVFGLLIAFSALSALIGFIAALRSFRRQQALSEMKSNFVSSVSHELRAPIASVRLMAENLERGKVPDASRQGEYFGFIVQECRRLSSLIENVLDFSRIEQGRKQYELEPTDVAALARGTVKLMEPYAAEKGVRLEFNSSQPATCELNLDGRAIQQALVNLIDNAVKHSPKGETVTVGLEAVSLNSPLSTINLFVADHGPGIPPEEHGKIFERFYRLGSELRRETQGVGIGLSIVKHIIEAHGGHVRVQSSPGQGSRFTIELPANQK